MNSAVQQLLYSDIHACLLQVTRNSAVDFKTVMFLANHIRADPARVRQIYIRDYAGLQKGLTFPQFNHVSAQNII
jgi:hypothetical protein